MKKQAQTKTTLTLKKQPLTNCLQNNHVVSSFNKQQSILKIKISRKNIEWLYSKNWNLRIAHVAEENEVEEAIR